MEVDGLRIQNQLTNQQRVLDAQNPMNVKFFLKAVHQAFKSIEMKRPVYEDRVYVRIQQPGDITTVIEREASDSDFYRFGTQYAAFLKKNAMAKVGFPLLNWSAITPAQCEELENFGITIVEELAAVTDGNLDNLGPGYMQLRNEAKAFVSSEASAARENEALKSRIEKLEREREREQRELRSRELAKAK